MAVITPLLVPLEQVKTDLQMDHNLDDADITLKIRMASAVVLNYRKVPHDHHFDSFDVIPNWNSTGTLDVPFEVQAAVILMVRELYGDGKQRTTWTPGYLVRRGDLAAVSLRDPTIG